MKSKKNRTMKTFEEIYRDAAVRNGCNAGKTFARVMFEEGMRAEYGSADYGSGEPG